MSDEYEEGGRAIGRLVAAKQRQYGDSVGKSGAILAELYPEGIAPHQYDDVLLTVRILDKLGRIAQRGPNGQDLGGESPWRDLCGYGLLGWRNDEQRADIEQIVSDSMEPWPNRTGQRASTPPIAGSSPAGSAKECSHPNIEPRPDDPNWGVCPACGDDTFPLTAEAAQVGEEVACGTFSFAATAPKAKPGPRGELRYRGRR